MREILQRAFDAGPIRGSEAYAFFKCDAPKARVDAEIPDARRMALTPEKLELEITPGIPIGKFLYDRQIAQLANEARQEGMNYAIRARLPGASNRETASELKTIMSNLYSSPLYASGEPFTGDVWFEENGEYLDVE